MRLRALLQYRRVDALTELQLEAAIASDPASADIPRDWFKRQGRGYQTRINAALRAFVEAHERK